MIDASAPVRELSRIRPARDRLVPLLRWEEAWYSAAGRGVVAGLLDTGFDERHPDLTGADLIVCDFVGWRGSNPRDIEHGTHSVTTLLGQGHHTIRGIAPRARLLVAEVVGPHGVANPQAVAGALAWIVDEGARVVAIPLGGPIEYSEIIDRIQRGTRQGVLFFAASGNRCTPQPLFPARHPSTIAVGAVDAAGNPFPRFARMSGLDVAAPGWRITAPINSRVTGERSGASVACVIAAGVSLLALSAGVVPPRPSCGAEVRALLSRADGARHRA